MVERSAQAPSPFPIAIHPTPQTIKDLREELALARARIAQLEGETLLPLKRAAGRLRISVSTARRLAKTPGGPGVKRAGRWLLDIEAVDVRTGGKP